jgi:hypothetical protein
MAPDEVADRVGKTGRTEGLGSSAQCPGGAVEALHDDIPVRPDALNDESG